MWEGILMRPVVVDAGVEFADDVPVLDRGDGDVELVGEGVVRLLVAATVLQSLDIVEVGGDEAVGVIFGCEGYRATHHVVVESAVHRSGAVVVVSDPAAGVADLQPLIELGVDLTHDREALEVILAVAHVAAHVHEVAGNIVVDLVVSPDTVRLCSCEKAVFL